MPYNLQPGNLLQAVWVISEQAPASPRAFGARLPAEVETIVLKSLDKDPDRRYQRHRASILTGLGDVAMHRRDLRARPANTARL